MKPSSNDISLHCNLGPIELTSPIILASGTSGHSNELSGYGNLAKVGAITVKSLCLNRWDGNKPPRISALDDGVINSVGLQGPGIDYFIENDYPKLEKANAKVILSIWGITVQDYLKVSEIVQTAFEKSRLKNLIGVEVNISCPNVDDQNRLFAQSSEYTGEIVGLVKKNLSLPVFVKLSPIVSDPVQIARAAVDSGADVLTLTNTMFGIGVDAGKLDFVLGNVTGGISGRPLKALAQSVVAKIRSDNSNIPIVGVGGIFNLDDMIQYWFIGANAVGIGSATFFDPRTAFKLGTKLKTHLSRGGYTSFENFWEDLQTKRTEVLDGRQ